MASSTPEIPCILPRLPQELINAISQYLDGSDLKALRETCLAMAQAIPLHFDRVFISANSLNIQVFNAIADHETFRHQVTEIIWDDARLFTGPEMWQYNNEWKYYDWEPDQIVTENGCPMWFQKGSSTSDKEWWDNYNVPVADNHMGLSECWEYYKPLLEDQKYVLATNADIEAFKHGLRRFTSLKRVSITPATHGRHYHPLYRTPMIRAFPPGFDYPIPKAWPTAPMDDAGEWQDDFSWISEEGDAQYQWFYGTHCTDEKYKEKWRGYQLVSRALVECENQVTELKIGGHEIMSGLNCRIFDQSCAEYDNFCTLLSRPGFRYVDLHLFTGVIEREDWVTYKTGLLGDALAQAKDIEHLSVRATTDIKDAFPQQLDPGDLEKPLFPLRAVFPIDHWPRLQHFGISNFLVELDDLIDVLSCLPPTLRCVELISLAFRNPEHGYDDLVRQMRDNLDWRLRPAEERPKVHMICCGEVGCVEDEFIEVDDAVCSYLYGDGENLFEPESSHVARGRGAFRRDPLDPDFRTPF
ncbi:uncharacterized protein FFUJ_12767 [Fusarium fujikuroi IMI 58289]|uniref:F-box domain-containing protein n=1 Tax=Gibberella fujikuroi (strain CBS 195.34 / IMI 58289 / NRRL A-6831) TaxID=1279085 RepID=S0EKE3_GIBF5|nr:uncharacterized protein FFUJ_12767 [Fusarium fujikuroi IMI 58289]CCT72873.1 uncharacterized protein FFUJ_12767 [Fusarium fujikuroi IMI 58289]SCO25042.1 uncharacterized protein FFM5_13934 [Fusarium fujikuroi]SCO54081.1 uncharacterized protein FFMR_11635 [Fusarium fujikuroi]